MQEKFEDLKQKLEHLENRKTQLADMCRIEQVVEMRERIRVLRDKLHQFTQVNTNTQP